MWKGDKTTEALLDGVGVRDALGKMRLCAWKGRGRREKRGKRKGGYPQDIPRYPRFVHGN
jgi:hypothetical protein